MHNPICSDPIENRKPNYFCSQFLRLSVPYFTIFAGDLPESSVGFLIYASTVWIFRASSSKKVLHIVSSWHLAKAVAGQYKIIVYLKRNPPHLHFNKMRWKQHVPKEDSIKVTETRGTIILNAAVEPEPLSKLLFAIFTYRWIKK